MGLPPGWQPWLLGMLALVVVAATLEGFVLSLLRRPYDWRAYGASMADALMRRGAEAAGLSLAAPLLAWAHAHRVQTLAVDTLAQGLLLFFGQELLYYAYHRAAHRVGWFWATHCVHHSPSQLTLATALRLGWTGKLTGTALFFVPLVWLGFSPLAVAAVVAANLLYQFWLHAPWMPRLGPLEWVLNTPAHHRVHHGCNPQYRDRNFGGVLIIFDRLFGSFAEEQPGVPVRYGLTEPLDSHNPLRISVHGWICLWRRFRTASGWRARGAVLLGPP